MRVFRFFERGRGGRRRPGFLRDRLSFLQTLGLVTFLALLGMATVWQNVRFMGARLAYDGARRANETLTSDLASLRLKAERLATLSQLKPRARERLGLEDPSTEDLRLVALGPAPVGPGRGGPTVLDRIVPAALATEPGGEFGSNPDRSGASSSIQDPRPGRR
jgi:hypothetical protein